MLIYILSILLISSNTVGQLSKCFYMGKKHQCIGNLFNGIIDGIARACIYVESNHRPVNVLNTLNLYISKIELRSDHQTARDSCRGSVTVLSVALKSNILGLYRGETCPWGKGMLHSM